MCKIQIILVGFLYLLWQLKFFFTVCCFTFNTERIIWRSVRESNPMTRY